MQCAVLAFSFVFRKKNKIKGNQSLFICFKWNGYARWTGNIFHRKIHDVFLCFFFAVVYMQTHTQCTMVTKNSAMPSKYHHLQSNTIDRIFAWVFNSSCSCILSQRQTLETINFLIEYIEINL